MSLLTDTGIWAKGLFVAQVGAVVPIMATAVVDPAQLANWKVLAAQASSAAVLATILYLKKSAVTIAQEKEKPTPEPKTVYVPIPPAAIDKPLQTARVYDPINGVRG